VRRRCTFFIFLLFLVLHASLGGATASQQHQGYTTKYRRGEIRQKKENSAAKGEFLLFILSIFSCVTARTQRYRSSDSQSAQCDAIRRTFKIQKRRGYGTRRGRAATIFKELLHRLEQGKRCTIFIFLNIGATRRTWRRHGATAAQQTHN